MNRWMRAGLLCLVFWTGAVGADLDTTFGEPNATTGERPGYALTPGPDDDGIYPANLIVQSDGKIVAGGYINRSPYPWTQNLVLTRYNADGTVDAAFNGGALLEVDHGLNEIGGLVGVQSSGKIVLAGTTQDANNTFFLSRYHDDGSLDATFADAGVMTAVHGTWAYAMMTDMIVDDQDRIVIAGFVMDYFPELETSLTLAFAQRYDANGTLDATFANGGTSDLFDVGIPLQTFVKVIERPDGGYVVGYTEPSDTEEDVYDTIAIRVLAEDGFEDETYPNFTLDKSADMRTFYLVDMAFAPESKLMLLAHVYNADGSETNSDMAAYRVGLDAVMDAGFGTGGIARIDFGENESARALAVMPNGKSILVGDMENSMGNDDFLSVRLNRDGSPDTAFSDDAVITTSFEGGYSEDRASDVVILKNGKPLVFGRGGAYDWYVVRYNAYNAGMMPALLMYLLN